MFYIMLLTSCEKVVYIDLNTSDSKIVVEANITNITGNYLNQVKLTKTVNYYDANIFPAVTGASVIISDDVGNSEKLSEQAPGVYFSHSLLTASGRSYSLKIISDGKEYDGFSTMPYRVPIDSIAFEQRINRQGVITYRVRCFFTDPPNVANYYRMKLYSLNDIIGIDSNNIRVLSDRLTDGKQMSISYRSSFLLNDSVNVILESIDKPTYEFYLTLPNAGGDLNPFLSSPPANPVNNISNGGLGYFAAYSYVDTFVVVH